MRIERSLKPVPPTSVASAVPTSPPRRDPAAEREFLGLIRQAITDQWRVGALADKFGHTGQERTPQEDGEMRELMRLQSERMQRMQKLRDDYGWDDQVIKEIMGG